MSVRQSKTETGRERGGGSVTMGGVQKERQQINVCERKRKKERERAVGDRCKREREEERDRGGGVVSVNLASRFCVYPLSLWRGGGLGSRPILKKFNEPYAPS